MYVWIRVRANVLTTSACASHVVCVCLASIQEWLHAFVHMSRGALSTKRANMPFGISQVVRAAMVRCLLRNKMLVNTHTWQWVSLFCVRVHFVCIPRHQERSTYEYNLPHRSRKTYENSSELFAHITHTHTYSHTSGFKQIVKMCYFYAAAMVVHSPKLWPYFSLENIPMLCVRAKAAPERRAKRRFSARVLPIFAWQLHTYIE